MKKLKKEDLIDLLNSQINIFPRPNVKFGLPLSIVIRDADGTQYFVDRQKIGDAYQYIVGKKLEKQRGFEK